MVNSRRLVKHLKMVPIVSAVFIAVAVFLSGSPVERRASASVFGPAPTFTGAPGEQNCTVCHGTFGVNTGSGNITISGMPRNYLPGQQIPLTVTLAQTDAVIFGFQMTSVDHGGTKAGAFSFPAAVPPILQIDTGFVDDGFRDYIEHTVNGVSPDNFGTRSWQYTWTAPSTRVGSVGLYVAGNAANSDQGTGGDYIYTTSAKTYSGTGISNFDADAASDLAVYRPSNGGWYSVNSSNGEFQSAAWGEAGDIPVPGDYDGDGTSDKAVFRPSTGIWHVMKSSEGYGWISFGQSGDIPVTGDYDGDLKTDAAVFRPSTGYWYVLNTSGGVSFISWGLPTDILVPGDYDGDAKMDAAVYRPSDGMWYVRQSTGGFLFRSWGAASDVPVQGDYDGDGKHDAAVFRPSDGYWYIYGSTTGFRAFSWGAATDTPAPADFDSDGLTDIAVFRPSDGVWYIVNSSDSSFVFRSWGTNGDVPIPTAYLR